MKSFTEKYLEEGLSPAAIEVLKLRRSILKNLPYTPQRLKKPTDQ